MRGLKDKTVIVTGAGGGIGSAIVTRFAEEGANVALFDMDEAKAKAAAEAARELGVKTDVQVVDITDLDAVRAAVDAAEVALGPVEVLVNNAGWDRFRPFLETEPEFWDKVIAINLRGPINLHHVVLSRMSERGDGGRVVNIASDAGRVGSSGEAVYSACKGGIVAFTKTMAREMARARVLVNAVCPGPTETPLFQSFLDEGPAGEKIYAALEKSIPLRRLGRPDDVPGMVAFLASDDAAFITGQVISVSGGLTMAG